METKEEVDTKSSPTTCTSHDPGTCSFFPVKGCFSFPSWI